MGLMHYLTEKTSLLGKLEEVMFHVDVTAESIMSPLLDKQNSKKSLQITDTKALWTWNGRARTAKILGRRITLLKELDVMKRIKESSGGGDRLDRNLVFCNFTSQELVSRIRPYCWHTKQSLINVPLLANNFHPTWKLELSWTAWLYMSLAL